MRKMTNVRMVPTSIEFEKIPTGIILWFNSEALDVGISFSKDFKDFKELEKTIKQAKKELQGNSHEK